MNEKKALRWFIRFIKGAFIGSGFILPGVSGGVLAAVFGLYERLISFLANLRKEFKKNLLFFIPVGLGGITGVFLFSFVVSFFLGNWESQILWFFIGCIVGTLPVLWQEAGKKGRKPRHYGLMALAFVLCYAFMFFGERFTSGNVPQNFFTWLLAGGLIGLGTIVPGLSPSNFLLFMGMYKDMADGIKTLDFSVILPLGIGVVACVLLLSKLMNKVLQHCYAGMFHIILGVVLASTVMIVPLDMNYLGPDGLVCALMLAGGAALGYFMGRLEDKYKAPKFPAPEQKMPKQGKT